MASSRSGSRSFLIAALVAASVIAPAALPALGRAPGVPAQVVPYDPPIRIEKYRYTDFGPSASDKDDRSGKAKFRVVERSGNCCENYITIDEKGTLYDLGGRYINFTEDDGKSWSSVQPLAPLVNGEGAIAMGPNGDVVGIEWDPYSADHLLSYKYDAAADQWQYLESPLHTPFYDRPWLTVVPGPFVVAGIEVPYAAFVDGSPHAGPLLMSTDGLTYVQVSNPGFDQRLEAPVSGWLDITKDKSLDWVLPNSNSPITPLGGGRAVAPPGLGSNGWSLLNPETLRWGPLTLPEGSLPSPLLVDSRKRMHTMAPGGDRFEYRISHNGGKSWKSTTVMMPKGATAGGTFDFRVNATAGVAAVAFHAGGEDGNDKDILFKMDITGKTARAVRVYEIGLGDINAGAGISGDLQDIRFDFETVAIFPDGRLAVSFLDSTTGPIYALTEPIVKRLGPALAIEL